ncbi:hypothetical protein EJ03DRAFT_196741 [Teratosphaeria nubilosa]|uniref:Rhomboid family membrane protein n=1 Tax=Teratosphaeria nubilosa TaxID=161662 RepID=A0A6G1L084_9PEZI|nr:hypothetical protein EJ03DRAFT_196741 [Teratosphaeria nubilosa]
MSHPQPPQRQPTLSETQKYAQTLHNVALVAVVACPIIALIPPRKLDFYTWGLVGTTAYSANYLTREQTGRSIYQIATFQTSPQVIPPTEQANLNRELQYAKQEVQRLGTESNPVTRELEATKTQREAWKAQREREIQDDLDVGKGFAEMIMDQIWEVWNWGKKRDDEDDG